MVVASSSSSHKSKLKADAEEDGSLVLSNSLKTIANNAFKGCTSLTSIELPGSVTQIGNSVFEGCTSLTSATLPNSITTMGNNTFYKCSALTDVVLSNSLTAIGDGTFYMCEALTSIDLPNTVTTIGRQSLAGCTSLTSIELPSSLATIGYRAFWYCTALQGIELPKAVATINNEAFLSCTSLADLVIGGGVTKINNYAFRNCTSLKRIQSYAVEPPVCGSDVFYGVDKSACQLDVLGESIEKYQSAAQWCVFYVVSRVGDIAADGVTVGVVGGEIVVTGADDAAEVEVYSMSGALISRGSDKTVAVPTAGVYVVRVAGHAFKVAVNII